MWSTKRELPSNDGPGCRGLVLGVLVATVLAVSATVVQVAPARAQSAPHARVLDQVRAIASVHAVMPDPRRVATRFLSAPQALTSQQIAAARLSTDKNYPTWAERRAAIVPADSSVGPVPGSATTPREPAPSGAGTTPGRFARFLEHIIFLAPLPVGLAVRMVAEPAIAVGDSVAWVTGNWFAARSTDGGSTWQYADPYADFPTFTSDQDAVFDPHRHLLLWYRQGGAVAGTLENSFKLNVSGDGATSWCSYTLLPTDLNPAWTSLAFDFPHLALSNNDLYITTTFLQTGDGFASPRMALFRLPLSRLAGCSRFAFEYWLSDEGFSWAPVDAGISNVMYLGDTLDSGGPGATTGVFRVFVQPEGASNLYYVDRAIPAWTFTERTGLCPVLGGGNPCTRADQRITSGWLRRQNGRGEVGFVWDVRDGGGFPYPYVDAVTLDEATLQVTGRPMLWDSDGAWQYGATAVNDDGSLAIAAFYFTPSAPPSHAVGFESSASPGTSPWRMFLTRTGEVPTATVIWGDYVRTRAAGGGFVSTGYTIGTEGAAPFLVLFGHGTLR